MKNETNSQEMANSTIFSDPMFILTAYFDSEICHSVYKTSVLLEKLYLFDRFICIIIILTLVLKSFKKIFAFKFWNIDV